MKVFSLFLTSDDNCDNKTQALPVNTYCNHKNNIFTLSAVPHLLTQSLNKSHDLLRSNIVYKYFSMYDKVSHFHASDDEY